MAVLGGLGAALGWAAAMLCSSRSSRIIGAWAVVAWVALTGLALTLPLLLLAQRPDLNGQDVGWLVAGGAGNVGGLLLSYLALRSGPVGVITAIVSCEGAVAAVLAIAAGQPLAAVTAAGLSLTALGVTVASAAPGRPGAAQARTGPLVLAALASASFGTGLYALAHVGRELPIAWALLPPRAVGALAVAVPLIVRGRLALTRRAAPLVVAAGLFEVAGFVAFTVGAREDVAVAAVVSSLFGPLAAGLARVLFDERLSPRQVVGIAAITAGVGLLAASG